MQVEQWRKAIGEMVRDHMRSPELEYYFSVKMNKQRAQLMITQLGLYIRHEFGEVIKDQYSEFGHLHLIIRQAEKLGLSADQVIETRPIPSTTATLYAWAWLTHAKPWIEGLAALTVTEWTNDDRLLNDIGGGHSTRMGKRWMEDMGLKWRDMPNFVAHSQADEEHSDMFLPFLSEYATGEKEHLALAAVKESLDLFALYREGVARAMDKIPLS
jgi:pyrroloquinoline quinone (PQQ) biosynthesis protein C